MTCLQSQTLEFKLQLQFYNKLVKNKKNSDNKSSIMDHTHKEASHRTFYPICTCHDQCQQFG